MKSTWLLGLLFLGVATLALAPQARAEGDDENEEVVPLEKVPDAIKKAATDAVKGLVLSKCEKETKGSAVIYELEGKADGKTYEVKVGADAKVIKVEQDEDDDGDDD